jgi:protein TonB
LVESLGIVIERAPFLQEELTPPHRRGACWPWLFSIGLHGLVLGLSLLAAQGLVFAPHSGSPYYVSLLPAPARPWAPLSTAAPTSASASLAAPTAIPLAELVALSGPVPATGLALDEGNFPPSSATAGRVGQSLAPRPGPGSGPFTLDQVDYKPAMIYAPAPVYPYLAQRRGIEGWVRVRFLVSREGRVSREEVIQAQPQGIFETSTLQALRSWRFSPGLRTGEAVDTWVVQVIRFKLTRPG